ncbi:hypothetical protein ACFWP2_21985 [Kitasatospora sp. NPDC058444]|uniref:hypothetical protein n=1 Tax=Kitasatospora sp. NPDC058444 TaxID=3346504 RepID=UPI00366A110C
MVTQLAAHLPHLAITARTNPAHGHVEPMPGAVFDRADGVPHGEPHIAATRETHRGPAWT